MTKTKQYNPFIIAAFILPVVFILYACGSPFGGESQSVKEENLEAAEQQEKAGGDLALGKEGEAREFPVPSPPFSKGVFPCSTCHSALPDNFVRRELKKDHTKIKLKHGSLDRWCFDCHLQHNRDKLRLSSGATVPFSESYKLCGQCHGPKLRDWGVGVHGKRTGDWDGHKQYLLCAHCHNPHSPRFKAIKPEPPPNRPRGQLAAAGTGHSL